MANPPSPRKRTLVRLQNLTSKYDIRTFGRVKLRTKHRRTLEAVFAHPVSGTIRWTDIEVLVAAPGGTVEEGEGSRVHFLLEGVPATFHRPHPSPTTDKGAVAAFRKYLARLGITP